MQVAILTTFQANKREPLAVLLERIHTAFLNSGLSEPALQFCFSDAPVAGFVSSVDRVLKRHPDLRRFVSTAQVTAGGPAIQQISNGGAAGNQEPIGFSTLLAVASGVPRSFPFHNLLIQFQAPAFGLALPLGCLAGNATPGIIVRDSWWVNGRQRTLVALTGVEADPARPKLPSPSGPVAAVLAACGKAKSTVQLPLVETPTASTPQVPELDPKAPSRVRAVVQDYRATLGKRWTGRRFPMICRRPPRLWPPQALDRRPGQRSRCWSVRSTKWDTTVAADQERSRFAVERPAILRCKSASASERGVGKLSVVSWCWDQTLKCLPLLVCNALGDVQYPIGDSERWQQIVDNLAALVAEYDRSFVPQVEAASGPAPAWYRPES